MNEKRMRKNRDGDTLGEKVKNYLEKLKKKDVSKLINDAFYELVHEQGVPFQIKRTNLLRDDPTYKKTDGEQVSPLKINRMINVPDEKHARSMELRAAAHEE